MRKKIILGLFGITLISLFCAFIIGGLCSKNEQKNNVIFYENKTSLYLVNSTSDSVLTYITLGSLGDTNYVQNIYGIFGILDSVTQGSFYIAPYDTVYYLSQTSKGLNGNITFGYPPQNCPDTTQTPNGINLFEFNLNDNFLVNAQETIDISCVSGANTFMKVSMKGGGYWNNGTDTIKSFYNNDLYNNVGLNGVYPFGCDSCVGITSKTPYCAGHKPYSKPQTKNICNIQRNANFSGGKVYVNFVGFCITE